MAYAAVTCLRNTIHRLLNSSLISPASPSQKNLETAYDELHFLHQLLQKSEGRSSFYALDTQITATVHELEDSLELHELKQLDEKFDLVRVITSSVEKLRRIRQDYTRELDSDQPLMSDKAVSVSDSSSSMVGLSDQLHEITYYLIHNNTYVFWIIGMAGIGKTALARRIYEDEAIKDAFECRAFVRIGQDYELEEIERAVTDQVNPNKEEDEELSEYLGDKRYLIVLDDVWSLRFWNEMFEDMLGDKDNGSCILVTTRIEYLAMSIEDQSYFYMPFLNEEESWDLLCDMVFSGKGCPRNLEKAGKEIAKKCDGLPLTLVTIANILSQETKSESDISRVEYWNEVAQQKNTVFEDAYDQMLEILYPSYYNLPPHARTCFLYMGAFPPKLQVRRSKLINMWSAEGFLEPNHTRFASKCFDDLTFHHVVVHAPELSSDGQTYKACTLHSVFRHLCRKELKNNGLLHIVDRFEEDLFVDGKRRLSIYNNVLLGIGVVKASAHESLPTTRSLLSTGADHPYQVSIDFDLRLLRVCHALTIRFYEFPSDVLELVRLRYLSITCNKTFPDSMSKLWKLEYLIVHQHLRIKSTVAESYLPLEIWDLQELMHLEIPGRNLPNPPSDAVLPKLVTLLDVGTHTCTRAVLTSTPNLEKLRVQIEVAPNSDEPPSFLDHISHLNALKSLQCVVMNPILISKVVVAPPRVSFDSSSITKLTLSGLGYPWQYLNKFAKLPHLKVLKLLHYAFQGEKWEVEEEGFLNLESLLIEDSNLVQWKFEDGNFPCLLYLTLRSCYKLQELPKIPSLFEIELVDCHSAALTWAKQTQSYLSYSWDAAPDSENYIHSTNYISCIYRVEVV